ncbi:MAG: nitroreductase family protein [Planctomycetota bacterium]|nr:MAG: nitroreductase family protein [Planctomycetota bacterium]
MRRGRTEVACGIGRAPDRAACKERMAIVGKGKAVQLLRELMDAQAERGWLDQQTLDAIARRHNVPAYRLGELVSFYPHLRCVPPAGIEIAVCGDVCCWLAGSDELLARLQSEAAGRDDVAVRRCSCLGRCDAAPAVLVGEQPVSARELVAHPMAGESTGAASAATQTGEPGDWVGRLTASAGAAGASRCAVGGLTGDEAPPNAGRGSPSGWRVDPYRGGERRYAAVRRIAGMPPRERTMAVIDVLQSAGLWGMGGAGFPTGRKWQLVAEQSRTPKYVICNADESEPGTFKDRVILAELSHLVVEGMVLAGLVVGAEQGIVFIRHEYGPERAALEAELERARRAGILGEDVAGSGRRFEIEVFVSPGGYILGEETALLECLEDRRGEPRNKPPYPGESGLWGCPTLINNVETLALATAIVVQGVDWWRAQGRDGYRGLKFVSVCGDVERAGVFEVPFGTPFSEIIALAGGVREGREVGAFLPGGASSRFLPASCLDVPLDPQAVRAAGSMLGTAAVIVLDETRDVLAAATRVLEFFRNESCGKCVPCRIGTQRGVELLTRSRGTAEAGGLARPDRWHEVLCELGATLKQTSICGLGQVAFDPVLSALELSAVPRTSDSGEDGENDGPGER